MKNPFEDMGMLDGDNALVDVALIDLYVEWNLARHSAFAPASLDLLEFPRLLDRCLLVDVRGRKSVLEGVIKFSGGFLVRTAEKELTGLQVSSLGPYPYMFRLVILCGALRRAVYTTPHQIAYGPKGYLIAQDICLPLSRDGKALSELLFAFSPTDRLSRSEFDKSRLTH